ncbi:MAG: hypothetical protein L0G94_06820 [Brachybacterium sp.]|uniref:hypothetical protein n=1 Tax=Brachybacterium sp. TaxID=1891286 RepID=UPI0026473102|nr:hypothetical protein [Brachybacterium sp.]MDN5686385.1 hypothetical protein [Brachybacterium sp.]
MKVPDATQDDLIEDLSEGKVWDSLSGADPVSTEILDSGETLETYADGSAVITGIEVPSESSREAGAVARASNPVTGCVSRPNDSAGYLVRTGCTVRKSYAVHGMKFVGDYKVKSGSPGRITDVRHGEVWSYISTYDIISGPSITKSSGYGSSPATARFSVKFTAASGYPTVHGWVQMNVATSAWVTWG